MRLRPNAFCEWKLQDNEPQSVCQHGYEATELGCTDLDLDFALLGLRSGLFTNVEVLSGTLAVFDENAAHCGWNEKWRRSVQRSRNSRGKSERGREACDGVCEDGCRDTR